MQLVIRVGGSWKCVSVSLLDGCVPCIAGVPLHEEILEPALWFKVDTISQSVHSLSRFSSIFVWSQVLVLNTIFIDCSERLISWAVGEDHLCKGLLEQPSEHCSSVSLTTSHHSLMAPTESTAADSLLCTNDLQSLFELAELLYRVSMPLSSVTMSSRASQVVRMINQSMLSVSMLCLLMLSRFCPHF